MDDEKLKKIHSELAEIDTKIRELKEEQINIVEGIKKDIKGWYKKWIVLACSGLSALTIYSAFTIYNKVIIKSEKFVTNSTTHKFVEPQITQTLNDVAENQAKKIIEHNLNPAIQKAISTVKQKTDFFGTDLQKFKNTYDEELKRLTKEVEYIKSRNMLLRLGDNAIARADAESLEKLENIYKSTADEDLKITALSEIFRVKTSFISKTRIKGLKLAYTHRETGKSFEENDIPTETLIEIMGNDTKWRARAKATELLNGRKENHVPEALLNAIQNDKSLEVRAKAMKSFEGITGFISKDIFNYVPAEDWWNKNKNDINLKDIQTIQSVLEINNDDENKN